MKFRGTDLESREFVGTDLDASLVAWWVQRRANREAGFGGCASDQIHDDLVGGERTPTPVLRDEAEESVFDLVPFAGAGGKVANLQCQMQFIRQALQRFLPKSIAATVAAAPIRRNQQFGRLRKASRTHLVPPTLDTRAGEFGCIVIDAHAHPSLQAKS